MPAVMLETIRIAHKTPLNSTERGRSHIQVCAYSMCMVGLIRTGLEKTCIRSFELVLDLAS